MLIHVVANDTDADTGLVGRRLAERHPGAAFRTLLREDVMAWPSERPDLLLLLGSAWSVHWPRLAREVGAECDLIRRTHAEGVPILGICYGAQITARALGGDAIPATRPEIGWCPVEATPETDAPVAGDWFQWHVDTFTLPPGARLLASNAAGPQAYRTGRTFATQFHPEVTTEMVARWAHDAGDDTPARLGTSAERLVSDARRHEVGNAAAAARLVDWFCDTVATAAG
jgi:GMP synthase-like glutamine amidotransferase